VEASDFAIDIAARRSDYARLFDSMQLAKGRWLNDLTCLNQARRLMPLDAIIPNPKQWNDRLAQRRRAFSEQAGTLDEAWLKYIAGASDVENLTAAESKLTAAYRDLASMSYGPLFSNASPYSLENVQSLLSPTEALLEVFVQTNAVYLLLITRDSLTPHKVEIGASDLGQRVLHTYLALVQNAARRKNERTLEATQDPDQRSKLELVSRVLYPSPSALLADWHALLLAPFAKELLPISRLVVCPHWALHELPFHALAPLDGSGKPVSPDKAITYSASATVWARLKEVGRMNADKKRDGDLVAGVETRRSSSAWWKPIEAFMALLGRGKAISDFEAEAVSIAKSLGTAATLGSEATKERILDGGADSDILHLSCHGITGRPQRVADGLLLADGVLTIAELLTDPRVAAWRPSLISLSACRSGVERVEPGDSLVGIGSALVARCSCPVLSSLWPVDVEATQLLMSSLFAEHAKDGDWAAALTRAQRITKMASSRDGPEHIPFDDPYFWAGFYLYGS
jgi:CHAT domain-containing protein